MLSLSGFRLAYGDVHNLVGHGLPPRHSRHSRLGMTRGFSRKAGLKNPSGQPISLIAAINSAATFCPSP